MENELLRKRIWRMEDEEPFLRWRSRQMSRAQSAPTGRPYGRLSGAEGMGPATVDLLGAAPSASLPAAA